MRRGNSNRGMHIRLRYPIGYAGEQEWNKWLAMRRRVVVLGSYGRYSVISSLKRQNRYRIRNSGAKNGLEASLTPRLLWETS